MFGLSGISRKKVGRYLIYIFNIYLIYIFNIYIFRKHKDTQKHGIRSEYYLIFSNYSEMFGIFLTGRKYVFLFVRLFVF